MLTKEFVIEAMKNLPEKFSMKELFSTIDIVYHIHEGLKDVEEGRVVPHEDVVKYYEERWKNVK